MGTRDHSHTRPADILIAGWDRGKPAALDTTVTSPLTPAILGESSRMVGEAASMLLKLVNNFLMPRVGVDLHSCSCGDLWKLGKGGPGNVFKAAPGHQHVFPQAYSFGSHLWQAKHYSSQVHCQSHPGKGSSSFMTVCVRVL